MDKSETYIKMQDNARKFLPKWVPQDGDYFCCRGEVYIYQNLYMGSENNEDCFPLYRQDQLQEMIVFPHKADIPNASMPRRLARYIADWYDNYPQAYWFTSMEQLWLAFVMKEKYNKVWNGNEWTEKGG